MKLQKQKWNLIIGGWKEEARNPVHHQQQNQPIGISRRQFRRER